MRTCLWLPKPAAPIYALRHACDIVMWKVSQVWLEVECDLAHNLTTWSLTAGIYLQSPEDSVPLVTSFLNVLEY